MGSLTDNLTTFVVLPDPRGFAPNGPANWASGFLPASHQATAMQALLDRAGTPVLGVVLNRTPVNQLNSYYKQYSAYYSG